VKFLIDNVLPPRLADLQLIAGYDTVHVQVYEMHAANDGEILESARGEVGIAAPDGIRQLGAITMA
jgi:predicted nuclease of predicted toxin-antitoxin system